MDRGKFKPKFNRIVFIDRKIREGAYPNASTLAEDYEGISARTIKRDIEWMRDFHSAPIEYSYERRGYYYSEENFNLPALQISESDLFAIAIAEQALEQYRNTPVYERLHRVFDKITTLLPESVSIGADWLYSRFTVFQQPMAMIDDKVWKNAMDGLRTSRAIRFEYLAPKHSDVIERQVQPYHAVSHKGQWYLIGNDEVKQEIRIFALSRMSNIVVTDCRFTIPADFSIDNYVDHNLGVFIREESYTVRLRVSPEAGPFFTERTWHDKQTIQYKSDGSLLLSFPTNQLEETMFWILSWGELLVVEEPPELVNMVRKQFERGLEKYKQ